MPKLTLDIDAAVVARAKKYAKQNHMPLSELVEAYLATLSAAGETAENAPLPPITRSLLGVIKDEGLDYREDYRRYLSVRLSRPRLTRRAAR